MFGFFASDGHWVHDLSPFLFQFPESWGALAGFGIRYYGLSYLLGFLCGYLLLFLYYKRDKSPYSPEQISTLITYLVVGVLVGGRIGYMLLYAWGDFVRNPLTALQVWDGGMASHGGFIGVGIAIFVFVKQQKTQLLDTCDIIATITAPGLFFGRMANFINGELWGKVSDVSWAIIFPTGGPLPRHPSQLYEAFTEGLLAFIIIQLRFWGKLGKRPPAGQIAGEFLIMYSVFRIFCEIFREPDAPLILRISRGQFYSIGTIALGFVFIYFARKLNGKKAA